MMTVATPVFGGELYSVSLVFSLGVIVIGHVSVYVWVYECMYVPAPMPDIVRPAYQVAIPCW